jgi:hypothetical protein
MFAVGHAGSILNMPRGMFKKLSWDGREDANARRHACWRSEPPGQHHFDLGLPHVRRRFDQLIRAHGREVGREQANSGEMEPPICNCTEQGRKSPGRSGRLDAFRCGILRQPQFFHAVRMHGRVTGRRIQLACVYLGNVGQERSSRHTILSYERRQLAQEDRVADMGQRVAPHGDTCSRGGFYDA